MEDDKRPTEGKTPSLGMFAKLKLKMKRKKKKPKKEEEEDEGWLVGSLPTKQEVAGPMEPSIPSKPLESTTTQPSSPPSMKIQDSTGVFGVSIEIAVRMERKAGLGQKGILLPMGIDDLLTQLTSAMEAGKLDGSIFRSSPPNEIVNDFRLRINQGKRSSLGDSLELFQVGGKVLREWYNELPGSGCLTPYIEFMTVARVEDEFVRAERLRDLLIALPIGNLQAAERLSRLLAGLINPSSSTADMDVASLALLWGPCLFHPPRETKIVSLENRRLARALVVDLMRWHNRLFLEDVASSQEDIGDVNSDPVPAGVVSGDAIMSGEGEESRKVAVVTRAALVQGLTEDDDGVQPVKSPPGRRASPYAGKKAMQPSRSPAGKKATSRSPAGKKATSRSPAGKKATSRSPAGKKATSRSPAGKKAPAERRATPAEKSRLKQPRQTPSQPKKQLSSKPLQARTVPKRKKKPKPVEDTELEKTLTDCEVWLKEEDERLLQLSTKIRKTARELRSTDDPSATQAARDLDLQARKVLDAKRELNRGTQQLAIQRKEVKDVRVRTKKPAVMKRPRLIVTPKRPQTAPTKVSKRDRALMYSAKVKSASREPRPRLKKKQTPKPWAKERVIQELRLEGRPGICRIDLEMLGVVDNEQLEREATATPPPSAKRERLAMSGEFAKSGEISYEDESESPFKAW